MEFGVPPDCKDSPFHGKWRLYLLDYVKGARFRHLSIDVKQAIKKFLDHPTSLPYDEERINNFMTNSMIIVDKEDLRKALDWFASARTEFFESVGEEAIRLYKVIGDPVEQMFPHGASLSDGSSESPVAPPPSPSLLVTFPPKWDKMKVRAHVASLTPELFSLNVLSNASAEVIVSSYDQLIAILRHDLQFGSRNLALDSTSSPSNPRIRTTHFRCPNLANSNTPFANMATFWRSTFSRRWMASSSFLKMRRQLMLHVDLRHPQFPSTTLRIQLKSLMAFIS